MGRRLLIIAPSAYLLGGVQNWLDYALPGFEESGYEVTLGLAAGHWHLADRYLDRHPWHRTITIENRSGSAQGRIEAIKTAIRTVAPDLVLIVNIGAALEAMAQLKQTEAGAPWVVIALHAIEGNYFSQLQHYGPVLDGVVVTNRLALKLAQQVARYPSERLHYAPYGVDLVDTIRASDVFGPVLWMGRLEQPQKRVLELPDIALELAKDARSWRLEVAGTGPEESGLKERLTQAGNLEANLLGHVEHEKLLRDILPGSGALLVNSTWETGPITIWEAMAAGVPVVSSRYTGQGLEGALVDGENTILFDVGDTKAAAAALIALRDDEALRAKVIESGRHLVATRYTKSVSMTAWLQAMDEICRLPRRNAPIPQTPELSGGRLDRMLGVRLAERVRTTLGIRWRHDSPGAEWPHARFGMNAEQQARFMALAAELDRTNRVSA